MREALERTSKVIGHETFGRVIAAGLGICTAALLAFVADLSTMDPGVPVLGWVLVAVAALIAAALSRLRWTHTITSWIVVALASAAPVLVSTALVVRTWRELSS